LGTLRDLVDALKEHLGTLKHIVGILKGTHGVRQGPFSAVNRGLQAVKAPFPAAKHFLGHPALGQRPARAQSPKP
jgi:hypothetical protein